MTWPTVAVNTTNADAGTDSPATFRTDVLDAINKLNQIIGTVPVLPGTSPSLAGLTVASTTAEADLTMSYTGQSKVTYFVKNASAQLGYYNATDSKWALLIDYSFNATFAGSVTATTFTSSAVGAPSFGGPVSFGFYSDASNYALRWPIGGSLYLQVGGASPGTLGTINSTGINLISGSFNGPVVSTNFPTVSNQSMVRLATGNGYGSTNTCIARFTTVVSNIGSDITYTDSASLGGSFTINTSGVYSINWNATLGTANSMVGISLNTSQPATQVFNIAAAERLGIQQCYATASNDQVSWTGYLAAGSVIRAHNDGTAFFGTQYTTFTISRVS
jgi:hypothetical protein